MDSMMTFMITLIIICLIMLVLLIFGLDWNIFKSKFMKNPTRLNIIHKSGKILSIIKDNKLYEKSLEDVKGSMRLLSEDLALRTKIGGGTIRGVWVTDFFYIGDSAEPVSLEDWRKRISSKEMKDLATLFEMAGANNFIPNLLKELTKTLTPYLIILIVLCVLIGIGIAVNYNQLQVLGENLQQIGEILKILPQSTPSNIVG